MKRIILTAIVLYFGVGVLSAQNTRSVDDPRQSRPQYQAVKKDKKGFFSFLKKDRRTQLKTSEEEKIEFRKRVSKAYKENAKTEIKAERVKRKEAKKGVKFHGHKRPPKKRPPGKQKFCKICRIKH